MKVVVTITQCRRVFLPWFFLEFSLPRMRQRFGGQIVCYLVQHLNPPTKRNLTTTSRLTGPEWEGLVEQWTKLGRFANANIVTHSEHFKPYASLPTYRLAVETALAEGFDLHLWLEDDALFSSRRVAKWFDAMKSSDAGSFESKPEYPRSSCTLVTPAFDSRMLQIMQDGSKWNIKETMFYPGTKRCNPDAPRISATLLRNVKQGLCFVGDDRDGFGHWARLTAWKAEKSVERVFDLMMRIDSKAARQYESDFRQMARAELRL